MNGVHFIRPPAHQTQNVSIERKIIKSIQKCFKTPKSSFAFAKHTHIGSNMQKERTKNVGKTYSLAGINSIELNGAQK